MNPEEAAFSNEKIDIIKCGPHATEAILICRGGYTPKRSFLHRGSEEIHVPNFLKVVLYAPDGCKISESEGFRLRQDTFHGTWDINTECEEIKSPGSLITNYSLTSFISSKPLYPHWNLDVIRVRTGRKAHLSDVFNMIKNSNSRYNILHCVHGRVDKFYSKIW